MNSDQLDPVIVLLTNLVVLRKQRQKWYEYTP
jgi:hypothetical protein